MNRLFRYLTVTVTLLLVLSSSILGQITSPDPQTTYKDITQSISNGGLWRLRFHGGVFNVDMNTDPGGGWRSYNTYWQITNTGGITFPFTSLTLQTLTIGGGSNPGTFTVNPVLSAGQVSMSFVNTNAASHAISYIEGDSNQGISMFAFGTADAGTRFTLNREGLLDIEAQDGPMVVGTNGNYPFYLGTNGQLAVTISNSNQLVTVVNGLTLTTGTLTMGTSQAINATTSLIQQIGGTTVGTWSAGRLTIGTGTAYAQLNVNGATTAGNGPVTAFQANSVSAGYIGLYSGLHSSTSTDLSLLSLSDNIYLEAAAGKQVIISSSNAGALTLNGSSSIEPMLTLDGSSKTSGRKWTIQDATGNLQFTDVTDSVIALNLTEASAQFPGFVGIGAASGYPLLVYQSSGGTLANFAGATNPTISIGDNATVTTGGTHRMQLWVDTSGISGNIQALTQGGAYLPLYLNPGGGAVIIGGPATTNGLILPLGSASSPAVTVNSGSSNTGAYWPTGTSFAITTAGTQAVQWDASQNQTNTGQLISTYTGTNIFVANGGTTNNMLFDMTNTSGEFRLGVVGSSASGLFVGSAAYAAALGTTVNQPVQFFTNNTLAATVSTSQAWTFAGSVTTPLLLAGSGSASVPSISSSGATTSGLYFPSSTSLAGVSNGAIAWLADSSHNMTFNGSILAGSNNALTVGNASNQFSFGYFFNLAMTGVVVANLPGSPVAGMVATVTDSTAIGAEGQTCVGGSSTKALAFYNGSVWKCF